MSTETTNPHSLEHILRNYYPSDFAEFDLSNQIRNIAPQKLELLIQNWTQRNIPLTPNWQGEECIKNAFMYTNKYSSYEVIKVLIFKNAKKIGIDPNPKLGDDAEHIFNRAHTRHGVNIENFNPAKCRGWTFAYFAKRLKLKSIVDLYKTYST